MLLEFLEYSWNAEWWIVDTFECASHWFDMDGINQQARRFWVQIPE